MELPNEIEWNVIKYMSHPVADLIKQERTYQDYQKAASLNDLSWTFSEFYFDQYAMVNSCNCCLKLWRMCKCHRQKCSSVCWGYTET